MGQHEHFDYILATLVNNDDKFIWELIAEADVPDMIIYWLAADGNRARATLDLKTNYVRFARNGRIRAADGLTIGFIAYGAHDALDRIADDITIRAHPHG